MTTRGIPGILGLNLWGIGDDWRDSRDSGVESVGYRGEGGGGGRRRRRKGGDPILKVGKQTFEMQRI